VPVFEVRVPRIFFCTFVYSKRRATLAGEYGWNRGLARSFPRSIDSQSIATVGRRTFTPQQADL